MPPSEGRAGLRCVRPFCLSRATRFTNDDVWLARLVCCTVSNMKSDVGIDRARTSEMPASRDWARGGRTLIAAFVARGTGWNVAQSMASLFLKPMQAEFGLCRTELSFALIGGLLVALMLALIRPIG